MEWLRPDIEEEFYKVENSIKRFMMKRYEWIEDIKVDKEKFQKNKISANALKRYEVTMVIDKKNLETLRGNEEMLDSAQEQFELLFNTVLESLTTFDKRKPTVITVDITPIIQDFS